MSQLSRPRPEKKPLGASCCSASAPRAPGLFDVRRIERETGAAFLGLGDQFIALMDANAGPAELERHFGLVVDDKSRVRRMLEAGGVEVLPGPRLDFRDPFGNRIQVVQYDQIRFTKSDAVLRGMGLSLGKSDGAIADLRREGLV